MISFIHVSGRLRPWQLFEPIPVCSEGGPEYDPDWLAKMRKQRNAKVIPASDWLMGWTSRNGTDPSPPELAYCSTAHDLDLTSSMSEEDWVAAVNGGTWGLDVIESVSWSDSLSPLEDHDYLLERTLSGTVTTVFGCGVYLDAGDYRLTLQFVNSVGSYSCGIRVYGPNVKSASPTFGSAILNTPWGVMEEWTASMPENGHESHLGFQRACRVIFDLTFTPHSIP